MKGDEGREGMNKNEIKNATETREKTKSRKGRKTNRNPDGHTQTDHQQPDSPSFSDQARRPNPTNKSSLPLPFSQLHCYQHQKKNWAGAIVGCTRF